MPFFALPQTKHIYFTVFALFFFLISSLCVAHEIRPSVIDITIKGSNLEKKEEDQQYQMSIRLNLEAVIAKIGAEHEDTNESDKSHIYDGLRQMPFNELIEEFAEFEPELLEKISLKFNQKVQPLNIQTVDIPDVGDLDLARISMINFTGKLPKNTNTVSWQWDESFGNAVLRVGTTENPELHSSYLLDGKSSDEISLKDTKNLSTWEQFTNYMKVGFIHIVPKGLDHILFVVGLFLLSSQLKPLLIQITSFTLAHSVTLALGIYGVIAISPAIVEPLIAASIIYICIENIFADKHSRWRPILIFLFGLLHGLGFASVLQEVGLSSSNFITSLVAFNIGVELGQLSVIAACFLLVGMWFRNKPWYRQRITIPMSIIIAIIASYWLVERTLLN